MATPDIALADVRKGDMVKKVNTPVLGVVENMSGYIINGKAKQLLHLYHQQSSS